MRHFILFIASFLMLACVPQETPAPAPPTGAEIVAACAASECGRLDLDRTGLDDYSVLADLDHVHALMVSYTDFSDLGAAVPLADNLTELHIGGVAVTDLTLLPQFPNLKLLHIQGNTIDDFTPISRLTQLEELAIGLGNFSDLNDLRGLTHLKRLNLNRSDVTDLAPLRHLKALEAIELRGLWITDFSVLLQMPKLRQVSFANNLPADIREKLIARGVVVEDEPVMIVC